MVEAPGGFGGGASDARRAYVEHLARFARHFGRSPALLGSDEIRAYQVSLTTEQRLAPRTIFIAVAAWRFLDTVPLPKPWSVPAVWPAPKIVKPLPVVLSPAEGVHFLDCVPDRQHRTLPTICDAAGLRISAAVHLTPPAIDRSRMVLRVEQGQGRKDRYVLLVAREGRKESAMKYIVHGDIVLSRPPEGPRATQIGAFAKWASEQGYARYSRYRQVLLAA